MIPNEEMIVSVMNLIEVVLTRMLSRALVLGIAFGVGGLIVGGLTGCGTNAEVQLPSQTNNMAAMQTSSTKSTAIQGAVYDETNQLKLPKDHREWIFVGAPVTPHDMNNGKAAFPEFHNVYINPDAFATYKKTGKFPDGTVVMKDLVSVGSKSMESGNGYFQGDYHSLEAMVKDSKRFSEEPGGWAFFRFGEYPNYKPVGMRMKTAECNACHSGAEEDFIFTSTYPVLRVAKPKTN